MLCTARLGWKMFGIVTGGSGSGKSEYAENWICRLAEPEKKLLYIAAMKPFDEECKKRIARHRKMRAHKGFQTIECYENIDSLELPEGASVLLECMSNLLANELFSEEKQNRTGIEEHILGGIRKLRKQSDNMVIVTNEIFSDGICYDKETQEYQRLLGRINCALAAEADCVVEVVCGIPVFRKGAVL